MKTKNIILIVSCILLYFIATFALAIGIPYLISVTAKVEINTNIKKYNDYIGDNAKEEYKNKWDMDETIFPKEITNNMNITDYKMVYYNPWDAQYLSYLVVEYDEEDYKQEITRLKQYKSTKYKGYYSVTGFDKYELVAMYADKYQGFVYAITDNKNTVIYVELIFCNYFYDLEYKKYIPEEYLPTGFDATLNNPYAKKMLNS